MAEQKLVIDGREYPVPDLGDLTMGDARIVKRYTGRTLDEVREISGADPDFMAALCHLVLQHDEPQASFEKVERRVNAIKLAQLEYQGGEEDDAVPPEPETTAGPPSAVSTSSGNGGSSGASSARDSGGLPETIPLSTGLLASGIGAA